MREDLRQYLRYNIETNSMWGLCRSINEIGPYVSNLSITRPLSIARLKYYRNVNVRCDSYQEFSIPKKSGGQRTITAPGGELKEIMFTLAFILSELYEPTPEAMAFITGRSIGTNASQHIGQNYVLNLDLKDFFTSITAVMVEKNLVKLGMSAIVAKEIATLCTYPMIENDCVQNVVPQGAPTSPVISNICAMKLDNRLSGLASRFHLSYTRYADDITFSSNHNVYHKNGEFMKELHQIIEDCHFIVNPKKTRLQKRGIRQEVTGITVNEKSNVSRKFVKNLRAAIHKIKYQEHPSMHDVNVVRGKLNFLRMIKGAEDSTYIRYIKNLNSAVKGKHFVNNTLK